MGTVSVKTFVAPKSLAMTYGTSRAQGAITFSWDTESWTGGYLDGPVWVYVPSGTISMSEPTPAQTTVSTKIVNGAEKNPTNTAGTQGFDENGAQWDVSRLASFPAALTAGDVIVKAKYKAGWGSARDGVVEQYASCFIVDSIPAANSFSPAAISWTGRTTKDASVVDVGAWVDANCPSYDTSGHTQVPSYSNLMTTFDKYNPVASIGGIGFNVYQDLTPNASANADTNYGEHIGGVFGGAALALCASSFSRDQKIAIATRMISHGKQWYDSMINEVAYNQNGGHFQFHLAPMAIYLHASGQTSALATLIADIPGNYGQVFQVTADMLANDFVRHTSGTKPYPWRERTLPASAVTGLDIKIPALAEDPAWCNFTGLILTRVSDAATATVTAAPVTEDTGGNYTATIDAHPTPAFTDADVVYFETPHPLIAGDYDWALEGYGSSYNPSPSTRYRDTNQWSGHLLATKALGCFPADGTAVQAYVEKANLANTPAAGFDFPDHHNAMYIAGGNKTWDAEWWTDYASTILA